MYPIKKNVLETVALLKAYNIQHIVLSPGSRNAPLIQAFSQDAFFKCKVIVDERHAAFYALGIIQYLRQPTVICCTSGTALLNYAPAVAEAFYQQLPLVIISADRAPEWIGQMDGQTLPQPNAFGGLVKKSVNLPEIRTSQDKWFCNRLINEALIALSTESAGPVHINIPLSEPLFDYSEKELPEVRKINISEFKKSVHDIKPIADVWNGSAKKLIIIGQLLPNQSLVSVLEKLADKSRCVVLSEHLANADSDLFIHNFDALLSTLSDEEKADFRPDLLITFGGHIVSKRIKHFLRQNKPHSHWHVSPSGDVVDLFQSLTDLLTVDADSFFRELLSETANGRTEYADLWHLESKKITVPKELEFSDIFVIGAFMQRLPAQSFLHLANSSSVRNAQLFNLKKGVSVYCNRGTNGIEGSVSTAVGFASVCEQPVYLVIGDLSFFYGLNSFWNIQQIKNLRILLVNNSGGGIFHLLPGLNASESLDSFVAAGHQNTAQKWVEAADMYYLKANNMNDFEKQLDIFFDIKTDKSIVLEAAIDMEVCKQASNKYYKQLKEKR